MKSFGGISKVLLDIIGVGKVKRKNISNWLQYSLIFSSVSLVEYKFSLSLTRLELINYNHMIKLGLN